MTGRPPRQRRTQTVNVLDAVTASPPVPAVALTVCRPQDRVSGSKVQKPDPLAWTSTAGPPSTETSTVPSGVVVPVTTGVVSVVLLPSSGEVMVTSAATATTVNVLASFAVLPAASVAVTSTVCGPSASAAGV